MSGVTEDFAGTNKTSSNVIASSNFHIFLNLYLKINKLVEIYYSFLNFNATTYFSELSDLLDFGLKLITLLNFFFK